MNRRDVNPMTDYIIRSDSDEPNVIIYEAPIPIGNQFLIGQTCSGCLMTMGPTSSYTPQGYRMVPKEDKPKPAKFNPFI